jgi:hypothetical protein
MLKLTSLGIAIALSIAMPLGIADTAFAFATKKHPHLSYEEAYKRCKVQVDKLQADAQSQRYSRGAACMHTYGYRL